MRPRTWHATPSQRCASWSRRYLTIRFCRMPFSLSLVWPLDTPTKPACTKPRREPVPVLCPEPLTIWIKRGHGNDVDNGRCAGRGAGGLA